MSEREQMTLDMVKNLALLLQEDNPTLSMEQALSLVINSNTYQRILNDSTRLYFLPTSPSIWLARASSCCRTTAISYR